MQSPVNHKQGAAGAWKTGHNGGTGPDLRRSSGAECSIRRIQQGCSGESGPGLSADDGLQLVCAFLCTPDSNPPQGFLNDVTAHLAVAQFAFDKLDWNFTYIKA